MSAQRGSGVMRLVLRPLRACVLLSLMPAIIRPSSPSVAVAGSASPTMWPSNITRMRSRERADFVELDRDEEDRLARVAHLDDLVVDELDGADVDAARRLADDQHVGIALHLAGEDDLLLVAAGEVGGLELARWPGGCRTS